MPGERTCLARQPPRLILHLLDESARPQRSDVNQSATVGFIQQRPARDTARRLAMATGLLILAACATVPGTGRRQLRLISQSEEMRLGADAYQRTLRDAKVVGEGPEAEMVQRVGRRISESAMRLYPNPAKDFQWEFVLIDDPEMVNAWALPGGKSAVYTGILPVTQDEDGLAVVLGHEVAHAIAHHGAERMSQGLLAQIGMGAASVGMRDMSDVERSAVLQALGVGITVGAILPFSRSHESEADELGLYITASAGYDPRAAIGLWRRMAKQGGGRRPPEFLSTHPSEHQRIERLQRIMPRALEMYEQAQLSRRGASARRASRAPAGTTRAVRESV
jgi:predicted Zn-dependent protease